MKRRNGAATAVVVRLPEKALPRKALEAARVPNERERGLHEKAAVACEERVVEDTHSAKGRHDNFIVVACFFVFVYYVLY
jgi:hypothetical protein